MSTEFILIGVVLVGATLGLFLFRLLNRVHGFGGQRLVTCPENRRPAAVRINALRAAAEALYGDRRLDLKACSRWPERAGCGQECLRQIESAPDGCLVKSTVDRYYAGRSCAICGKTFAGAAALGEHRPALLGPDRVTVPWHEIPAETLPEVLSRNRPVCWDCHIVQTLMREHPGLAVVRPPRPPVSL